MKKEKKPYKYTEIQRTDKLLFICPFCGLAFKGLAYHTRQKHKINAKELRRMFGLKSEYQLITPEIKERHRDIAIINQEGKKLMLTGIKTRYKKGHKGHTKDNWSNQALKELSIRQTKVI